MAFWAPGEPGPPPNVPSDLDRDADAHRPYPFFNSRAGLPLQQQRAQLPISKHRLSLLHAVETHQVVVLSGPTGCGKSTQLPQYLDEAGWTADGYVVGVTVPRRLAAVALASRVAQEMGEELGRAVGYKIRFDNCTLPGDTRVEFMTEGILLREMLSDPLLTRYGVLIVDEAHERSTQTELLLGLLKKIVRKRPQLRLIVASATLDVASFVRFFQRRGTEKAVVAPARKRLRGWDDETGEVQRAREEDGDWRRLCQNTGYSDAGLRDVCFVAVEGRLHSVKIHYLEEPACDYIESAVGIVLAIHAGQADGDVLVFLSGREEILAVCALLKERTAESVDQARTSSQRPRPLDAVPLFAALPKEAQEKAFRPGHRGARKVVVSTNIAEASVTIENIVYVVDSCLVKLDAYCPHNGVSYLNIASCSQSSSRQRAGRAGRTRPGHCYRLLTEAAFLSGTPKHTVPEIVRSDVKSMVLLLKCLGVDDVAGFEFVAAPTRAALELALEELHALGAIDADARVIEPFGPRMAHGPLPPALMRLLLVAAEPPHSCAAEAASLCAMMSLKEPWLVPRGQTSRDRLEACRRSFAVYEGDLVTSLNVLRQYEAYREEDKGWAQRHMLDKQALERALQVRRQLELYLRRFDLPVESCGDDVSRIQRLVCAALFLNAARMLPNSTYRLLRPVDERRAPHSRFFLHPTSALFAVQSSNPADFIVFAEAQCSGDAPRLAHCTRIRPEWLGELAPHYFEELAAGTARADT